MNKIKHKLSKGGVTYGAWLQIGHLCSAEILADAGFDWICVDMEHAAIDISGLPSLFAGIESRGSIPFVRVPENDNIVIRRCVDAGAKGIIVPMVNTVLQAEAAVRSAKYPPQGVRGFGYCRANQYGKNFKNKLTSANDEITVILQIEHIEAIQNLEEILSVKGVDAVFIGPLDLSGSMGHPGQLENLEVKHALNRYLTLCKRMKVPPGLHILSPDKKSIAKAVKQGYRFIAIGLDVVFLAEGAKCAAASWK
ncbi:MAG: 2,4-dihydroxyhept-2-ene-1,7-dioic acid aldolase [Fibrobacteres bacterium]|nr:2,4-dihydroxyhept-2-ene-1,7-dioic acid aldolase [Fibrobacterota bacterium]